MFPIKDVTDGDLAFGAYGEKFQELIPPKEDIPAEFSLYHRGRDNPWVELQGTWFFEGLKGYTFVPKEGVDPGKAFNHLRAIQSSWEPSHEDKVQYVSFLLSEWFDDVIGPDGKSVINRENR